MSDASPQSTASAVIVGLARDCARDLPAALRNLATMAACFPRAAFIFAENDSVDGTAALLRDFAAGRSDTRILTFAGLDKRLPQRTRRLAFLRNQCLAAIRSDARLRASVFANCRGPYYDLWALRHETLCPGDVWEEAFDYALAHGGDDDAAYAATVARRVTTIAPEDPPLAVASAFGGLGIYKLRAVQDAAYKGFKTKEIVQDGKRRAIKWQVCEHVAFNAAIGAHGGRLFVLPFLISRRTDGIDFVKSFYRQ